VLDTSYHRHRLEERLRDPAFRAEYERTRRELEQVNEIVRRLDVLRVEAGLSKADLARGIGRNDAVIRRLFTAQANPELRTVAALADALDADVRIIPRQRRRKGRPEATRAGG
jgi:ribosome-binding protein aMBF1 (putative translation factor)